MQRREKFIIRSVACLLIGFGLYDVLGQLVRGNIIEALRSVPIFYLSWHAVFIAAVVAGVGLWLYKEWARRLAVIIVALVVACVALTMLTMPIYLSKLTDQNSPLFLIKDSYFRYVFWGYLAAVSVGVVMLTVLLSRAIGRAFRTEEIVLRKHNNEPKATLDSAP